jgi:membrane-bound lytic murein transglycosylase B
MTVLLRSLAILLALTTCCASAKPPRKPAKAPPAAVKPKIDYVGEAAAFTQWKEVAAFLDDVSARHGIARAELDAILGQARLLDSAIQLVKPAPPGKPKNWTAYSALMIEPVRIKGGARFWNEHAATLARAEAEYGVPADIIVGILGVETVYGRNTGRFRVIDVLATLGFAYPDTPNRQARMMFFRQELENTLLLARQQDVDPFSLLGSFAGAVGLPQFMPGSILRYGVDYDGDGHVDLRNSPADAIGSVANFLVQHGWDRQQRGPLAYPATVSLARGWERYLSQGLSAKFTAAELDAAGATTATATPPGALFGLVNLENGAEPTHYWLATNNFFVITQYNRSYFYAMSVIELGKAVRAARELAASETISP